MSHANKTWLEVVADVLRYGAVVMPRGQETKEVLSYTSVWDMNYPVVCHKLRKLSYKFMFGEAAWILAGSNKVSDIEPYNKKIKDYSDNGVTFFGAYGPKVRDQLGNVIDKLEHDPDSRQALLTIWRENPPPTKDYPCTVSLQWLIRDGKLHCFDTMRSSDVWWGLPYDVFNMSVISWCVLTELNRCRCKLSQPPLELGSLYLTAASQHLYQPFYEEAKACLAYVSGEDDKQTGMTINIHKLLGYCDGSIEHASSELYRLADLISTSMPLEELYETLEQK